MVDPRSLVEAIIYPVAARYDTKPEHWIRGDDTDEGLSYCCECAETEVARLKAEDAQGEYYTTGGYCSEGDSQAFCETCLTPLDNSFTDYACESELDHFEENGFDSWAPSDCHSLANILSGHSVDGDSELSERIRILVNGIVGQRFRDAMGKGRRIEDDGR